MSRDARVDPKKGDVLRIGKVERIVLENNGVFVTWTWPRYACPSLTPFSALIEEWRIDQKDAEVIHHAG